MRTDDKRDLEIKGLRADKLSYDDYESGYERKDPTTGIVKSTIVPQPPQNLRAWIQNGLIELHWDDQQNLSAPHKFEVQRSADGDYYKTIVIIPRTIIADTPGFEHDPNGNPTETVWWYRVRIVVTTTQQKSGWSTPVKAKIRPIDRLDINSELAEILENGGEVGGKLLSFANSKGVELTEAFSNWGDLSNGYTTVDAGGQDETTKSLSYIFNNFVIADVILGSRIRGSHIEAGTIGANHITISTVKDIDPDALNQSDYDTLQSQIDDEITTYFYFHTPALDTIPAVNWTDTEKSNNVGDIFYCIEEDITVEGKGDSTISPDSLAADGDSTTAADTIICGYDSRYFIEALVGSSFRFVHTDSAGYYWTRTNNTQYEAALEVASDAQATADSKIVSYYQNTPPTGQAIGDIWYDTSDQNKPYWWDGDEWKDVQDGTIYDALTEAQSKTTTYTADKPDNPVEGDLFYNTNLEVYEVYRDGAWEYFDPMNWRTSNTTEIDGSRIKAGSIELSGMSPGMVETIELVGAGDSTYDPTGIIANGDSMLSADDLICGEGSERGTNYYIQAIPPGEVYFHGGNTLDGSVEMAKLGRTIIEGGYIKTELINTSRIWVGDLYGSGRMSTKNTVENIDVTDIDGGKIHTGSITANKIAANSITADKVDVGNLSAISANIGTVTSGRIESNDGASYFDLNTGYIKAVSGEFSGEVNGAKFQFINTGVLQKDTWNTIGNIDSSASNVSTASLVLDIPGNDSIILAGVHSLGETADCGYIVAWEDMRPKCLIYWPWYTATITVDTNGSVKIYINSYVSNDCDSTVSIGDARVSGIILWN